MSFPPGSGCFRSDSGVFGRVRSEGESQILGHGAAAAARRHAGVVLDGRLEHGVGERFAQAFVRHDGALYGRCALPLHRVPAQTRRLLVAACNTQTPTAVSFNV